MRQLRSLRMIPFHMGFASVFEEEGHITVEGGLVTGRRVIDNRGRKVDKGDLGLRNLPGGENRFPGKP